MPPPAFASCLPDGLRITGADLADAQAITDVANAASRAEIGIEHFNVADILTRLRRPGTDLSRDWVLVWDGSMLVGAIEVSSFPPHDRMMFEGFVHIDAMGRGIGTFLLDAALARAEEAAMTNGLDPVDVGLQQWAWSPRTPARDLLESFGFREERWFHHRVLDITPDDHPSLPPTIEGIQIRPFRLARDERATFLADNEIFQDHWGFVPAPFDEWCAQVVERDDFDPDLTLLAWDGDQVAGLLFAAPGHGANVGEGHVNVLGVRRQWRRHGVATALLVTSLQSFRAAGAPRFGLYVDSDNPTGAVGLYERLGMREGELGFIAYTRRLREVAEDEASVSASAVRYCAGSALNESKQP